jgi:hypothetical protein
VSVDTRIPVGFGMLTCDTEAQALDRAGLPGSSEGKGYEAAQAAIATVLALHAKGNASELRQCPTKPFRRTSPGCTVGHQAHSSIMELLSLSGAHKGQQLHDRTRDASTRW